jgi:regulator of replication initiation timing
LEIKIQKLEESNLVLMSENEMLVHENRNLKGKLNHYMQVLQVDGVIKGYQELGEAVESLEEMYSQAMQELIDERKTCK